MFSNKRKIVLQKVSNMFLKKSAVAAVMVAVFISCATSSAVAQTSESVPPKVRQQIQDIDQTILGAGRLFKKGDYAQSAKLIAGAQNAMVELMESADNKTVKAAELTYRKLAKAHQLLTGKGESLAELKPLARAIEKPKEQRSKKTSGKSSSKKTSAETKASQMPSADVAGISFVNQVAPVLLDKCGNCHVNDRRGNFSAASFGSLDNSAMITFGMADDSRLVEVIESGEMPPTNRKVTAAELQLIKRWIDEGAKFDGKNPGANLTTLVRSSPATDAGDVGDFVLTKPTGAESVSFGLHVAPILLENCARCHIARNPQSNFNMANFAAMMRGGNSGQKPLLPGQGAASEIVLRMKGQQRDVMPPSGKLDDQRIALVEKWIDQGARFDPADVRLPLRSVAAKGLANSMDHDRLTEHRNQAAAETWRLALSGVSPTMVATENFSVIGTGSKERLQAIGTVAESIAQGVTKVLGSKSKKPFVKGGTTLFVVDKRYDFSEFGRMVDQRAFDKTVTSSWQSDTVVARVLLLSAIRGRDADYEASLARDIASVHVANLDASVPRWFADGMGYSVAAKLYARDPMVQQWQSDAAAAATSMKKANDFISGEMPPDQSALASYRFVEALQGKGRAMKTLLNQLWQGVAFESAFADAYGTTPEKLLENQW